MKRKGLDAMAVFAQLLVLIAIFLLASYANAFLNLNQVAGNQIQLIFCQDSGNDQILHHEGV